MRDCDAIRKAVRIVNLLDKADDLMRELCDEHQRGAELLEALKDNDLMTFATPPSILHPFLDHPERYEILCGGRRLVRKKK